ncbi:hypothetical protein [Jejuia pallidilutea]|uniref:Uncharacterized protein n=1 Tax=Jejuia pallidilutea TaxID=504487 RepID=A0A090W7Y6_9FLAO|nr:hypothetical protein [Jejuia pallidilutea]GAL72328.1 hypothetical protein JCM19302_3606 [Jejuia pallidilutea]
MGLVDAISNTNDKAVEVSERYVKTSLKYYKLKVFQQLSISVSIVFKALIIGSLALMCVLISAVGLALFIGESTQNYPFGFLMVGLLFLILSIIVFALRRLINKWVIKKLSKKFFD